MSFPSTGILDNFNRADVGPPPSSSWTNFSGGLKVVSNRCVGNTGGGSTDISYWNVASYTDTEIYGTVGVAPEDDLGTLNLYFRVNPVTANGYVLVYSALSTTDTLTVFRLDAGVPTQLGATINQNIAVNDVIGISMVGSTITVYLNGTALTTRTDSTYSAAGRIALGVKYTTTSGAWDDFGGGTYTSSSSSSSSSSCRSSSSSSSCRSSSSSSSSSSSLSTSSSSSSSSTKMLRAFRESLVGWQSKNNPVGVYD